jgi:hypothetical protein
VIVLQLGTSFLLARPLLALADMSATACKEQLAILNGVAPSLAALQAVPAPPPLALSLGDHARGFHAAVGDDVPLLALLAPEVVVDLGLIAGDDGAATPPDVADLDVAGDSGGSEPEEPEYPTHILGQHVTLEVKRGPSGAIIGRGLRVVCMNPAHNSHSRYRSVILDNDKFGNRAAEFYLQAWLTSAYEQTEEKHKGWRPPVSVVREIAETYGN